MTYTPPNPPLKAVFVSHTPDGEEYYEEGRNDVSSVEWHEQPGHMAAIPTIRVFKDGKLHSEHSFHVVQGVYYKD